MRGLLMPALVASCGSALTVACHGGSVLRGEQYRHRDAAHDYDPIHQKFQQE